MDFSSDYKSVKQDVRIPSQWLNFKKTTAEICVTAVVLQQSQTVIISHTVSNKYTVQALHMCFLFLWNTVTLPETLN